MRAQTLAQVRLLPLARLHGRYGRPCARTRSLSYLRDPTVVSHDRYEVTAGACNTVVNIDSVRRGRRRSRRCLRHQHRRPPSCWPDTNDSI